MKMDDEPTLDLLQLVDRKISKDFLLEVSSTQSEDKAKKMSKSTMNHSRVFLKMTLLVLFLFVVFCLLLLNLSIASVQIASNDFIKTANSTSIYSAHHENVTSLGRFQQMLKDQPQCKVHFLLAGSKTDYNMRQFHTWLQHTKTGSLPKQPETDCSIGFIKEDHQLMTSLLTPSQKWAAGIMSSRKVILADYMKLLAMYYYGGVSTDFDVELKTSYPSSWFSDSIHTKSCSVLLGVEHDCWSDDCIAPNSFAAKGQIETWALAAHSPKSPFLLALSDRIEKQLRENGNSMAGLGVQQVAGSGIYSMYLREVLANMGLGDYGDIKGVMRGKTLKEDKEEVVHINIPQTGETICLLGENYLRFGLLAFHHFEGSWKKRKLQHFL